MQNPASVCSNFVQTKKAALRRPFQFSPT